MHSDPQPYPQGIQGQVLQHQGNVMPSIGNSAIAPVCAGQATTIWIFAGRIPGHAPTWPIAAAIQHTQLWGTIATDHAGQFIVTLPAGEYTLFAQVGNDLYLNSFLGDGSYETVTVSAGEMQHWILHNTQGAVF